MPIVKTQLRESHAKRELIEGNVKLGKLKNNIAVTNVREIPSGTKDSKVVAFEFTFTTDYSLEEPKNKNLGDIKVVGEVIYLDSPDKIDEILKEWKKNKKLKGSFLRNVLNVAFEMAQIEAIEQAKKVGLPPPVPLLRFRSK